jgi:hypothetical protein
VSVPSARAAPDPCAEVRVKRRPAAQLRKIAQVERHLLRRKRRRGFILRFADRIEHQAQPLLEFRPEIQLPGETLCYVQDDRQEPVISVL